MYVTTIAHRIAAAVFALLLYTMAWLQLNDPDPALWVAIYMVMGSLSLATVIRGVWRVAVWTVFAIAFAWSAWLSPSVYELFAYHSPGDLFTGMSPDRPYVEESREALGLMIGVVAMLQLLLAKPVARR